MEMLEMVHHTDIDKSVGIPDSMREERQQHEDLCRLQEAERDNTG